MRHDPIAKAHAQLGRARRERDKAREIMASTGAELGSALSIVCRLPDTPERTAIYAILERAAGKLAKHAGLSE